MAVHPQADRVRVDGNLAGSYLALDATANAVAISARGYAAVFEKTSSGWVERKLATLRLSFDYPSDIAISGSTAAVGGIRSSDITGFVFQKSAAGRGCCRQNYEQIHNRMATTTI